MDAAIRYNVSVLSQRTVGRLQRLLEMMFTRQGVGPGVALTPREYSRRLYEANIPNDLLEHLAHHYGWRPELFVRALHDGGPVAYVLRNDGYGDPVPSTAERVLGDKYLLDFAAVALQRYDELAFDEWNRDYAGFFTDAVSDFAESLSIDGYLYRGGRMLTADGHPITPENIPVRHLARVGDDVRTAEAVAVAAQPAELTAAEGPSPERASKKWTRGDVIGFWTLVLALLAIIVAVANPEVRRWVGLEKPKVQSTTSESANPSEKTQKVPANTISTYGVNSPVVTGSGNKISIGTEPATNSKKTQPQK